MTSLSTTLGVADEPQDWGIANADASRLAEFLEFLRTEDLGPTQTFALLELILASANEQLVAEPFTGLEDVERALRRHPREAAAHREYWSGLTDAPEFPIAAWLRRLN